MDIEPFWSFNHFSMNPSHLTVDWTVKYTIQSKSENVMFGGNVHVYNETSINFSCVKYVDELG